MGITRASDRELLLGPLSFSPFFPFLSASIHPPLLLLPLLAAHLPIFISSLYPSYYLPFFLIPIWVSFSGHSREKSLLLQSRFFGSCSVGTIKGNRGRCSCGNSSFRSCCGAIDASSFRGGELKIFSEWVVSFTPPAFDMMRYQRLSPDCLPLPTATTGRKPDLAPHPNPTPASGSPNASHGKTGSPNSDSKRGVKSASDAPSTSNHGEINGGGDLLLQWGHNKRTRGPRTSQTGDDSASSSHLRSSKIQRRSSVTAAAEKLMPPPQQLPVGSYTRGANLRSAASLPNHHRAVEEHHNHRSRGEKKNHHHKSNGHHHHTEGGANHQADAKHHQPSDHDLVMATSNGNGAVEKAAVLEHFEWPRIYISLSRKEKEDDFLAMKGTKLPQRPKKRAKNVDKTLQYVFPGMWLSDLTKGRYEVREKKCVKKKRRGLKGMESMDSDSE